MPKIRPTNTKAVLQIFWDYTKKYPWLFGVALFGGIIAQSAQIVAPLFIGEILNLLTQNVPTAKVCAGRSR